MYIFSLVFKKIKIEIKIKMDHFLVCQLCRNCKKGCKVFKFMLSYYDQNGKITLNPIQRIRNFAFQCEFCGAVSVVDVDNVCTPSTVIELKRVEKERKEQIKKLLEDFISLLN